MQRNRKAPAKKRASLRQYTPENQLSFGFESLFSQEFNHIVIRLNSQTLDRSMLRIARTLLHEMIHAELYRVINEAGYRNQLEAYIANTGNLIIAAWAFLQGNSFFQHEEMAKDYIDEISEGLRQLHPFLSSQAFINYNNNNLNWSWDSYFTHLAYAGLSETQAYNNFYNTIEKRTDRNNYLLTETMETNDCQ